MVSLVNVLDMCMLFFWVITYILALIGTIKYKYPLMEPISQFFLLGSLETAIAISLFLEEYSGFTYVNFGYITWTAVEWILLIIIYRQGYLRKKQLLVLLPATLLFTAILVCTLLVYNSSKLILTHVLTFTLEAFWLKHSAKKDYPRSKLIVIMFLAKLIADLFNLSVYLSRCDWWLKPVCIGLPILDLMFLDVYFMKNKQKNVRKQAKPKKSHRR